MLIFDLGSAMKHAPKKIDLDQMLEEDSGDDDMAAKIRGFAPPMPSINENPINNSMKSPPMKKGKKAAAARTKIKKMDANKVPNYQPTYQNQSSVIQPPGQPSFPSNYGPESDYGSK